MLARNRSCTPLSACENYRQQTKAAATFLKEPLQFALVLLFCSRMAQSLNLKRSSSSAHRHVREALEWQAIRLSHFHSFDLASSHHDSRSNRSLHPLQIHRLRGRLPGGLFP